MSHHPHCPAAYFVDHPERCRCVILTLLDLDDATTEAEESA